MRILFLLFVYLLVLDSGDNASVPKPEDTKLVSNNFIHILQWRPGNGTRSGTVYNVNVNNNQVRNITGTSTDISKYMSNIYILYEIQLWASFGNRLSSKAEINFSPYTNTVIGPPKLSLSGCGDCLRISIDLPNRQRYTHNFYITIEFDLQWRKASDEKDGCKNSFNNSQRTKSVPNSYILRNLQPGERYCVQAQPMISSLPDRNRLSSCSCEFTSRIEPRGVGFLAGWVASSVLVGSCFLTFLFFLVYAGFLCKPYVRLPKALTVIVPGFLLSLEETSLSVVEVENGVQIHNQKKINDKSQQIDEDDEENDDDDDDSQNGYMNRKAPSESGSTGSVRSAPDREAAENPIGGCDLKDTPTHAADALLLSQVRYNPVKTYSLGASLDTVPKSFKHSVRDRDLKRLEGEKKKEVTEEDSGDINLWSVVLKSMQQQQEEEEEEEEEEVKRSSDATEPLLPSSGKEVEEKPATPQTGRSVEHHTALLFRAQTDTQEKKLSDTSVCENTPTGYMASHGGTIDTEDGSDEDDCMSGYMSR